MQTIVVGVDGSDGSLAALRFALEEAGLRGAQIKAVGVWHIPAIDYEAGWTGAPIDVEAFSSLAEAAVAKGLAKLDAAGAGVAVSSVVREGQAADVLCAEAAGADLLVVGSRGLGGFRSLLLGSVSQQCAAHAPCPVVIVPHAQAE
jgi:nucleotide-binding universal stress UspA family protein